MRRSDAPEVLTPLEAASRLGVTTKVLADWANQGLVGFFKTLGGHHRYPEDAIRQARECFPYREGKTRKPRGKEADAARRRTAAAAAAAAAASDGEDGA